MTPFYRGKNRESFCKNVCGFSSGPALPSTVLRKAQESCWRGVTLEAPECWWSIWANVSQGKVACSSVEGSMCWENLLGSVSWETPPLSCAVHIPPSSQCAHIQGVRRHDRHQGKTGEEDAPLKSHGSEWKLSRILTQEGNEARWGPPESTGAGRRDTHPHVAAGFCVILPGWLLLPLGSPGESLEQGLPLLGFLAAQQSTGSQLHVFNGDGSLRLWTITSFPSPAILPPTPGTLPGLSRNYWHSGSLVGLPGIEEVPIYPLVRGHPPHPTHTLADSARTAQSPKCGPLESSCVCPLPCPCL